MKRYLLGILYIFLLTFSLGAIGNPASVSITLTTSVPGYLLHGFLDSPGTTTFIENPTVNDAFNPAGAILKYGIKTNTGMPLVVKATISPFSEKDGVTLEQIPIKQVKVNGDPVDFSGGKYQLLTLTPTSGTIFYAYTLTVLVDQSLLVDAPPGNYQSTVAIDIST